MTPASASAGPERRAIWASAAGNFLVRSGFGFILPGLPLYIRVHAIPEPYLGLGAAAYLLLGVTGMLLLAPLSDRLGHVRALFAGAVLNLLGALVLLSLPSAASLLAGRALQGLGMALFTPATAAYISAGVHPDRRGGAYGTVASAQMAGFILGPALGGVALGVAGPTGSIMLACVAAALTVLVTLALPPEPAAVAIAGRGAVDEPYGARAMLAPLVALMALPWGFGLIAYNVGQQIPSGVYDTVWSLYMFHLGAAPWLVGASFAVWAVPLVVLSPMFGRRAAGMNVRLWMALGGALMSVAACGYALSPSPYMVTAIGFFEGMGSAAVLPLSQIYLAARVPAHRLAGATGAANGIGQAAALAAAVAAGYLFELRAWMPFLIAAAGLGWGTWTFARRTAGAADALPVTPDVEVDL